MLDLDPDDIPEHDLDELSEDPIVEIEDLAYRRKFLLQKTDPRKLNNEVGASDLIDDVTNNDEPTDIEAKRRNIVTRPCQVVMPHLRTSDYEPLGVPPPLLPEVAPEPRIEEHREPSPPAPVLTPRQATPEPEPVVIISLVEPTLKRK